MSCKGVAVDCAIMLLSLCWNLQYDCVHRYHYRHLVSQDGCRHVLIQSHPRSLPNNVYRNQVVRNKDVGLHQFQAQQWDDHLLVQKPRLTCLYLLRRLDHLVVVLLACYPIKILLRTGLMPVVASK